MRIGITGSTGFIGSHILKALRMDHQVITFSRRLDLESDNHFCVDLADSKRVAEVFKDLHLDLLIHTAAIANPNPTPETVSNIVDSNVKAALNISNNYKGKILNLSSIVVYGAFSAASAAIESSITKPISLYGITKLATELIFNLSNETTHLRMGNIVGQGLTHGVVKDITNRLINENDFYVYGAKPGTCKPYLYIDDLIDLIKILVNTGTTSDVYNVVGLNPITIEEVANVCMNSIGIVKNISWDESKTWLGDNNLINASVKKLDSLFGWSPSMSSQEAIEKSLSNVQTIKAGGVSITIEE